VWQHRTNALLPHDALDKGHQFARLGAAIPWAAAFPAMPTDHVLLALTGGSRDSAPEIKDCCVVQFR
jgi:hypothetical protein